jgi:tRNA pseudouridine55 synthase
MDGILNINKSPGKTSFSVVSLVKRLSGERRVGHAGTLDPAATGVLPVCLGQGTRVSEYLMEGAKVYRAEIELGITTDTYDADGTITCKNDPSGIGVAELESALSTFLGTTHQVPPMYSAVKYHGKPLYKLARDGITVKRKSRPVNIYKLELIEWQLPVATIEVVCGKGTYIRSLAYDLGQSLGCGAHLKGLVRSRYGLFNLKDALSLTQLEDAFRYNYWQHYIYPIDIVLSHLAAIVANDDEREDIINGRPLLLRDKDGTTESSFPEEDVEGKTVSGKRCRVYTLDGIFLAVLSFDAEKGYWRPEKVFQ